MTKGTEAELVLAERMIRAGMKVLAEKFGNPYHLSVACRRDGEVMSAEDTLFAYFTNCDNPPDVSEIIPDKANVFLLFHHIDLPASNDDAPRFSLRSSSAHVHAQIVSELSR